MPSRAEMRARLEQGLRGIVLVVLAAMLWRSLHEPAVGGAKSLTAREVSARKLIEWSGMSSAPAAIQLALDSVPSPIDRAWLRALGGAGTRVQWKGNLPGVMVDAQPIVSPIGGTVVRLASSRSPVVLGDDAGVLDTLRATNGGSTILLNDAVGAITARAPGATGSTTTSDSVLLRKVLVLGSPGWETKFAAAALEEAGWNVDELIRVAPGVHTTQGAPAPIDTSHYSAVVAVDAGVAPYAGRIVEFARTGGGVVLWPAAAALEAMASIRAGAVGRASSASRSTLSGSVARGTLPVRPIASLRSDAVTLEARNGIATVAARRVDAGRVLQLGYEDTWRWRMSGGEGAVRDHRYWLSGLVSSVAFAPRMARASAVGPTDEAPLADFVGAVGWRPSTPARAMTSSKSTSWPLLLFVLLTVVLVAEVGSRRLRGAP